MCYTYIKLLEDFEKHATAAVQSSDADASQLLLPKQKDIKYEDVPYKTDKMASY